MLDKDFILENDEMEQVTFPSFDFCSENRAESALLASHRQWLREIRHEKPSPRASFKVAVYIRYFNQTKYKNYLDYHKQQFLSTLSQYPNWHFVDFYVDEGSTAPNMESAPAWSQLLCDCDAGKVDLIITQKVSNVSKKIHQDFSGTGEASGYLLYFRGSLHPCVVLQGGFEGSVLFALV